MWNKIASAARTETRFSVDLPRALNERSWVAVGNWLCMNVGHFDDECLAETGNLNSLSDAVGTLWQTKAGTLPKRIAKYISKVYGRKIGEVATANLGMFMNQNSHIVGGSFEFDFTDEFDWDAGDFGDAGSCFWSSNESARGIMRSNGVVAIRFYNRDKGGRGCARAWVAPAPDRSGFVVFNAYGYSLEKTGQAVIDWLTTETSAPDGVTTLRGYLSNMQNNGDTTGTVYINRGLGYVVEPLSDEPELKLVDLHMKKKSLFGRVGLNNTRETQDTEGRMTTSIWQAASVTAPPTAVPRSINFRMTVTAVDELFRRTGRGIDADRGAGWRDVTFVQYPAPLPPETPAPMFAPITPEEMGVWTAQQNDDPHRIEIEDVDDEPGYLDSIWYPDED